MRRTSLVVPFCALAVACTGGVEGDQHLDRVFDPCQVTLVADELDDARLAALQRALVMWGARPSGDGDVLEIRLDDAAASFHGLYDDEHGVIYLNRSLPAGDLFTIAAAHELGHAFGLWHVAADERGSVMNPGNLEVGPTAEDHAALIERWGACSDALSTASGS